MSKISLLFIIGTRPEAIKLAPLIKAFQSNNVNFIVRVCSTGQHREMVNEVLTFFNINIDVNLDIMQVQQSLFDITTRCMKGLEKVLNDIKPDWVFVQGDTTTAFVGALSAYYLKIKVAHVEAGLRSFNKYAPFPEEMNRKLISHIVDIHFAATENNRENLLKEGIEPSHIQVVGNTVVDALHWTLNKLPQNKAIFKDIDFSKKIILVTAHRRENWGAGVENIIAAISNILKNRYDIQFVLPLHPNPIVSEPFKNQFSDNPNVQLLPPLSYEHFVDLMNQSFIILTDSGGVQEEAISLRKPVLVMRNITERSEGIDLHNAVLVGTHSDVIEKTIYKLLDSNVLYTEMTQGENPYGDGNTSDRILKKMTLIL